MRLRPTARFARRDFARVVRPPTLVSRPSERQRAKSRQLLCLLSRHVGFPVAHDGVEDGQELSGDGNEGELCRFAGLSQLCVEDLEAIGAADRVEGGHVEGITDTLAPAADLTLAAIGAAVDV